MTRSTLFRVLQFGALVSALFFVCPGIDRWVSGLFVRPDEGFWLGDWPPFATIRLIGDLLVWSGAVVLAGAFVVKTALPLRRPPLDLRAAFYLLACLALGPGLVVNAGLKDHWGRPRPVQVESRTGAAPPYQRVWVIGDGCASNCSFVSGEVASAVVWIALVPLVGRRWRRVVGGAVLAWAGVIGAVRIAQGGHYLSDVLLAGVITWLVAWAVHWLVYVRAPPFLSTAALGRACVAVHDALAGLYDELWLARRRREAGEAREAHAPAARAADLRRP